MNVRGRWQHRPGSAALLALVLVVLVLSALLAAALRPLGYSESQLRNEASRRYSREISWYFEAVHQGTASRPLRLALSPLVDLHITVNTLAPVPAAPLGGPTAAGTGEQVLPPGRYVLRAVARWDVLGALVLALLVLGQAGLYSYRRLGGGNHETPMPVPPQPAAPAPIGQPLPPASHPAEQVFAGDIARLQARADDLDKRSSLFLTAGIGAAVSGLLVYMLAPRPAVTEETSVAGLLATLQPAALLVFAEAIAFFLLRQSRAMVSYHSHYVTLILKRNNWVAALRMLQGGASSDPAGASILTALVGEVVPTPGDGLASAEAADRGGAVWAELLAKTAGNTSDKK